MSYPPGMAKAKKTARKGKPRPPSLGGREAAPMPFKDVVQKLLEAPPPDLTKKGR